MPEIWKGDHLLVALPPALPDQGAFTSMGGAVLVGQPGGGMSLLYRAEGSSAFPEAVFGNLRLQMLDPFGNLLGNPITLAGAAYNPILYNGSLLSGAAMAIAANGMHAVAYAEETWVSPSQRESAVWLRMVDPSGVPAGGPVGLNIGSTDPMAGSQSMVALTTFQDGSFAAVWQEAPDSQGLGGDGSGAGIFMQRFNQSGGMLGGLLRVNTQTDGSQTAPSITTLNNGDALVTWISGQSVHAQRVTAAGALVGGEQVLHALLPTTPGGSGAIESAQVVALPTDGFALVYWVAYSLNILFPQIEAQFFDAAGAPVGASRLVLNTAVGFFITSYGASAAADGGLSVGVAWVDALVGREGVTHADLSPAGEEDVIKTSYFPDKLGLGSQALSGAAVGHFADGREMLVYDRASTGTADSLRAVLLDGRETTTLTGTENRDVLVGHGPQSAYGIEILVTLGGNDHAYGLDGNDYLYMGDGDDVAVGGAGFDVLVLEAGNDYGYGGLDQDYIYAGDGQDTLIGEDGRDVLLGEGGDDTFDGGADGDYIYGGAGNDYAYGRDGNDIFVMESGNDTAFGEQGQDYFYMGEGDDQAHGGEGVDVFLGEAGHDVFEGGTGVDYAWGGSGNDRFVVRADSGVMVIGDFTAGGAEDALQLTPDTGITTLAQALAASTYFAGMDTTVLTVDADTLVWLVGVNPSQLTAGDFVFG